MPKKLREIVDRDVRTIARSIARDSIVTDATARLIEQVMTATHERMVELMAEAVKAERERCAKAAEDDTSFDMQSHSAQLRANIAEAIRSTPVK